MHHALLLAGGSSSRMGQDKRQLEIDGSTLLDRSLALLTQSGADRIIISGDVPGYPCVPDLNPGSGPPGGLHSALTFLADEAALDSSPLLIIPVDMPLLDSAILTRLVNSLGEAESCHYADEMFPCVFRLTQRLKAHLDQLFQEQVETGGARSMRALLKTFAAKVVPTEGLPENVFMNLNNPDDWEKLLSKAGKKKPVN